MPTKAEWDRHKPAVVALAVDNPLKTVVQKMKDDHGFTASTSQYEAQLKVWDVRKNLKQHEWKATLKRLDSLSQKKKTRLLIFGRVVPEARIRKTRQRYCHSVAGIPQLNSSTGTSDVIPECVSFETLGGDQTWTLHTGVDGNSNSQNLSTPITGIDRSDPPTGQTPPLNAGFDNESFMNAQADDAIRTEHVDYLQQPFHDYDIPVFDMTDTSGDNQSLFPSLDLSMSWDSIQLGNRQDTHEIWFKLLRNLAFTRLEKMLETKGINLRTHSTTALGHVRASGIPGPVTQFLADIANVEASLSNGRRSNIFVPCFEQRHLTQSFKSLLPGEPTQGGNQNEHDSVMLNEMLGANFNRLLICSTINGFTGLESVPVSSILRFLGRHRNVSALLQQVLDASPVYLAKALAENLFKAAIEAQEGSFITQLLTTGLVDVNSTVCYVSGNKFTPLERATMLRSLVVTTILLEAKADVNRTYSPYIEVSGPLPLLILGIKRGATITQDVIALVQKLLEAGAKVHLGPLKSALSSFHSKDLLSPLAISLSQSDHEALVSTECLDLFVRELEDNQASDVVSTILQTCNQTHSGHCLIQFAAELEWALIQSAMKGHLQVVQLLLPYSKSLSRVLSASIRSGRRDLIDLILTRKPRVDGPAHSIDQKRWASIQTGSYETITTPLAEAIMLREEDVIHLCEDVGALRHLDRDRQFEAAMAAASKTENTPYARKLFHHHQRPHPDELSPALLYSIENDNEELFFQLLDAGANVNLQNYRTDPTPPTPLFAAMLKRNERIVHAILDADVYLGSIYTLYQCAGDKDGRSILDEAIRWGNRSIIEGICHGFDLGSSRFEVPHIPHLLELLDTGNEGLFAYLFDQGFIDMPSLTRCLRVPVTKGDETMLHHLIGLGANPLDSDILDLAAEIQPGILRFLLDHAPRRTHRVPRGIGTSALEAAIRQGLSGLESVNILLQSKAVDIESIIETEDERGQYNNKFTVTRVESPLGQAIRLSETTAHADFALVRILLKAGCNPNSVVARKNEYEGHEMQTGLLAAIQTKSEALVRVLMEYGAAVNPRPIAGIKWTPLQRAAKLGCLDIVKLLLEHGADVNAPAALRGGGTALQCAAVSGNCNIAAELLSHGANLFAPRSRIFGKWPLENAAEHGRLEMIEYLWKASGVGFDVEQCERAMQLAEANGFFGCKELIKEFSASRCVFDDSLLLSDFPINM